MPTRNINLTKRLDDFVERQIASGRYGNASEVVREALRGMEEEKKERAAKLKALRQAAKEGFDELDQGKGILIEGKNGLRKFMDEIMAEVKRKRAKNGAQK